jgi:hypothetical protein
MSSNGRRVPAAVLLALSLCASAVAEDRSPPTADHVRLTEWLDDDVGLCLEIDNLGKEWEQFCKGRLCQGLAEFPPAADWLSRHRPGLLLLAAEIERRTGVTPRELATKLLGRQLLFAIWPPANPLTDKPSALLLAESTDGQLMRRSLERLVAARRLAGRWRGRRTVAAGGSTFSIDVVVPDEEQSEFFVAAVGDIAVFANDEALLREVLQRRAAVAPGSLASSPAYLAAGGRLAGNDAARLFINPRAWDAALEADLKQKPPGSEEAKSQAVIVAAWRAIEYVAGGLQLAPQPAVELAWEWRLDALPEPVREVAASLAGSSRFVDRLPDDALIAFAGRVDVKRLIRYGIEHKEPADRDPRNQLDSILFWALAAGIGPDWGGFLIPARDRSPSRSVDLVVGFQTHPLEAGPQEKPLAAILEPVLHALLASAVESVNRQSKNHPASLRSTDHDGSKITTVLGIVPDRPEQELAYCVDRIGQFWFGTSAAAVERASVPKGVRTSDGESLRNPSGLVRVNLAEWRNLAARGQSAVEFLWEGKQLDAKGKEREYQSLLAFSRLADRLVMTTRVDESRVHLSCALETSGRDTDEE